MQWLAHLDCACRIGRRRQSLERETLRLKIDADGVEQAPRFGFLAVYDRFVINDKEAVTQGGCQLTRQGVVQNQILRKIKRIQLTFNQKTNISSV